MSELDEALRRWAKGIYPSEAGVELLIRQGRAIYEGAPWLIETDWAEVGRERMVALDVDQLLDGTGGYSGGESRVIRIAVSLLGGPAVNLNEDVPGLDRERTALVLAAIAHANGSHEHSGVRFNDDGTPAGFTRLTSLYPWPESGDKD